MHMIRDIENIPDEAGDDPTSFICTITNVFYSNIDFTAGELTIEDTTDPIRFSGEATLGRGDYIEVAGEWIISPKYGKQFSILDFSYLDKQGGTHDH